MPKKEGGNQISDFYCFALSYLTYCSQSKPAMAVSILSWAQRAPKTLIIYFVGGLEIFVNYYFMYVNNYFKYFCLK